MEGLASCPKWRFWVVSPKFHMGAILLVVVMFAAPLQAGLRFEVFFSHEKCLVGLVADLQRKNRQLILKVLKVLNVVSRRSPLGRGVNHSSTEFSIWNKNGI